MKYKFIVQIDRTVCSSPTRAAGTAEEAEANLLQLFGCLVWRPALALSALSVAARVQAD